ncbi:MAG: hypothetical protein IKV97_05265 [Clostridia bacterium]|nr:hypothetical protein [Clostridia bacterium]
MKKIILLATALILLCTGCTPNITEEVPHDAEQSITVAPSGFYNTKALVGNMEITVDEKGISKKLGMLRSVFSTEPYSAGFAANLNTLFACRVDGSLVKTDLLTGEQNVIFSAEEFSDAVTDYGKVRDAETAYRNIIGVYGTKLYFNEFYDAFNGEVYIFDLSTNKYTRTEVPVTEFFVVREDKIYHGALRFEYFSFTIYEADPELKNSEAFLENVLHYGLIGNKLYYIFLFDGDPFNRNNVGQVRVHDFETGGRREIGETTSHTTVFADFGYANIGVNEKTGVPSAVIRNYDGGEFVIEATNCSLRDGVIFAENILGDTGTMECHYIGKDTTVSFVCEDKNMHRLQYVDGKVFYIDDNGEKIYPETTETKTVFENPEGIVVVRKDFGE